MMHTHHARYPLVASLFLLLGVALLLLVSRTSAQAPFQEESIRQGTFAIYLPYLSLPGFSFETGCKDQDSDACGTREEGYMRDPATRYLVGDFNGDGEDDIFIQSGETSTTRRLLYLGRSDGEGFTIGCEGNEEGSCGTDNQAFMRNPAARFLVGDFNGDGRDDLFVYSGDAGFTRRVLHLGRSDGRGFNISCQGQLDGDCGIDNEPFTQHANTRYLVGDFNGDGEDDIFLQSGDPTQNRRALYVGRDDGTGFDVSCAGDADGACGTDNEAYTQHVDSRFLVGDFNGDNRDDIFVISGDTTFQRRRLLLGRSSGGGFDTGCEGQDDGACGTDNEGYTRNPNTRYLVGDFNGDGEDDIFVSSGDNDFRRRMMLLGRASGSGFDTGCQGESDGACGTDSEPYMRDPNSRFLVGDYNGNNRDDLFLVSADPFFTRRRVHFGRVDGAGFNLGCEGQDDEACGVDSEEYTRESDTRYVVGDFNGDGRDDVFIYSGDPDFTRRVLYLGNGASTGN